VLPRSMLSQKPEPIMEADCEPEYSDHFVRIMEQTGRAGSDGSGETLGRNADFRMVGAGAGAVLLDDQERVIEAGFLCTKVPGRQTASRVEAWAFYMILKLWHGRLPVTIVVDASYVINGLKHHRTSRYPEGVNSDIWRLIDEQLEPIAIQPVALKIKSHIDATHLRHIDYPSGVDPCQ
jgi:hypothetical protein